MHARRDDTTSQAEIAVLGGGTAGCALAARLVAAGRDVTVVEAGPDYGALDGGGWPVDLLDAGSLPTSHDWGYRALGAGGQPLALDRARVLGGCSTHNGCTQNWGWGGDYDAWGRHSPGWSAADLLPAFGRAREALRLREYAVEEIQPFQAAFLDACAGRRFRLADDFDDLDGGAGAGCAPVNIAGGVRFNAAAAYLDPVRGRPGLRVLDRAPVERLVPGPAGEVTVHVRTADGPATLVATEVVVCAGAYGTPELLLRSGIGDPAALARSGVAVEHALAGVGRGLQEHQAVHVEFDGTAALAARLDAFRAVRWMPEEQAILKLASPECEGPYDLHVYPWVEADPAAPHGWKCVFPVGLLTPGSRGVVTGGERAGAGTIDHRYLSDPRDARALEHGLEVVEALVAHPALAPLLGARRTPRPPDAGARAAFVRRYHQHYWHPGASCPMGPDPDAGAVVDAQARVHGLPGVRIADASVFPALPRGTTALPTVVVGERVAELMAPAT